jgi:hypothetical protein
VLDELGDSFSADRPFSFRYQFTDAWYDLHNPELVDEPKQMIVTFATRRADFPPNLEALRIAHVALYFARADGESFEVPVSGFSFTPAGAAAVAGGAATTVNALISTRRSNAAGWLNFSGQPVNGTWELNLRGDLADGTPIRDVFRGRTADGDERIKDLLLVVTYSGHTPPVPA